MKALQLNLRRVRSSIQTNVSTGQCTSGTATCQPPASKEPPPTAMTLSGDTCCCSIRQSGAGYPRSGG